MNVAVNEKSQAVLQQIWKTLGTLDKKAYADTEKH